MQENKTIVYELKITKNLFGIIKDYCYEMEYDLKNKTINDFVIDAIIEKFNEENTIFNSDVDKNGFIQDEK